jgi:hypothetical protein
VKPKIIFLLASPLLLPTLLFVTIHGPDTEQEAIIKAALANKNIFFISI